MATAQPLPVTALEVGSCFVGQYYVVLQSTPEICKEFYKDDSIMSFVRDSGIQTANGVEKIHSLIMSTNIVHVGIKRFQPLFSYNGGILLTVFGLAQVKKSKKPWRFVQTFFLAPQDTGYYILTDILHFISDELLSRHPFIEICASNHPETINYSQPVNNYFLGEGIRGGDFDPTLHPDQHETNMPQQSVHGIDIREGAPSEVSSASSPLIVANTHNHLAPVAEEQIQPIEHTSTREPKQHTYASVLRRPSGPISSSACPPKSNALPSEWNRTVDLTKSHQGPTVETVDALHVTESHEGPIVEAVDTLYLTETCQGPTVKAVEVASTLKHQGTSVFVKNIPNFFSTFDLEQVFQKIGKVKPCGVRFKTYKDRTARYAFVEFEDIVGAQNAIMASPLVSNDYKIYIEECRSRRGDFSRRGAEKGADRTHGDWRAAKNS